MHICLLKVEKDESCIISPPSRTVSIETSN